MPMVLQKMADMPFLSIMNYKGSIEIVGRRSACAYAPPAPLCLRMRGGARLWPSGIRRAIFDFMLDRAVFPWENKEIKDGVWSLHCGGLKSQVRILASNWRIRRTSVGMRRLA